MDEVDLEDSSAINAMMSGRHYLVKRAGKVLGELVPVEGPRSVSDVVHESASYFIPGYQRGYRWTDEEVKKLLTDIQRWGEAQNDSRERDKGDDFGNRYSLQPIVLKNRDDNTIEVLDGQQRLTTLYIVLRAAGVEPSYSISYETREGSAEFLREIADKYCQYEESGKSLEGIEYIDYYYFLQAYGAAREFFETGSPVRCSRQNAIWRTPRVPYSC